MSRNLTNTPHRLAGVFERNTPPKIAVVGCGGTGSLLAEMLCRLLIGTPSTLLLVDPDEVEPHNLLRQNFLPQDIGCNKARCLAERLSQQYQRTVGHSQNDCRELLDGGRFAGSYHLTIGCVDNPLARAAMDTMTEGGHWVMDCGNSREQGQVLLGNMNRSLFLMADYNGDAPPFFYEGRCHFLPSPATQEPDLLTALTDETHLDRDCAQAVLLQEQAPLINQAMALAAAQMTYKLLTHDCTVMGLYLDITSGHLRTVPASPANAARCLRLPHPEYLME